MAVFAQQFVNGRDLSGVDALAVVAEERNGRKRVRLNARSNLRTLDRRVA
jgi:hypothetical protein